MALVGQDWDPTVFYYARRKGLMIRGQAGLEDYAHLRTLGYTRLFVCPGSGGTPCDIIDLTAR